MYVLHCSVLWILLSFLLSACGPDVPSSFPRPSPASTSAEEATPAVVGVALREDPPLPGADAGWVGLSPAAPPAMSGHHHMPGMDMGGMDMGGMDMGPDGGMGGMVMDGGHDAH